MPEELSDADRVRRLRRLAKRLRRQKAEADSRCAALVAGCYDAFVATDHRGKVIEWNPAASVLFGWTAEEACGRQFSDLLVPERLRAEHRQEWQAILESGNLPAGKRARIVPRLTKDGAEVIVEVRAWCIQVGGKAQIGAVMFTWETLARAAV